MTKFDRLWRASGGFLLLAGILFYVLGIAQWYAIWVGIIGFTMLASDVGSAFTLQMMRFFDWLSSRK